MRMGTNRNFGKWKKLRSGKVRDVWINEILGLIALVASDRVSAFDKVLAGNGIPNKGIYITSVSNYWALRTAAIPNAYVWDLDIIEDFCEQTGIEKERVTIQRITTPLPIEAIVRGHVAGSAWRAYENGEREICGVALPEGLRESERLPSPIFTPTTKGEHDENITYEQMVKILEDEGYDRSVAEFVRDSSIRLYSEIYSEAEEKGLIFADTKFEIGYCPKTKQYVFIDEIGTSDSSRYWSLENYEVGVPQEGFDKEIVRRYVRSQKQNGVENPTIPPEIVEQTAQRYKTLMRMIVGE